jgi:hypothetical protein
MLLGLGYRTYWRSVELQLACPHFDNFGFRLRWDRHKAEFKYLDTPISQPAVWEPLHCIIADGSKTNRNVAQNSRANALPGFVSSVFEYARFGNLGNVSGEGNPALGWWIKHYGPDGAIMRMLQEQNCRISEGAAQRFDNV